MARVALRALLLATTLLAPSALAEKPRRDVRLSIEDCTPGVLELREAYAAAALELGLGDTAAEAPEPGRVELDAALACDHGVKARLTLRTADQSASRSIPLDDVRVKDRPRVLALALAELVRAEWRWVTTGKSEEKEAPLGDERHGGAATSHDEAPTTGAATAGAATSARAGTTGLDSRKDAASRSEQRKNTSRDPSEPLTGAPAPGRAADVPAEPPSPERGLSLEVLGKARELFEGPTFVYGASFGARWHRWYGSVEALFGGARGALGTASLGTADARVGYELVRASRGHWLFALEPALAGGVTWLTGTKTTPDVTVSNKAGFYGDARLALRTEYSAPFSPTLSFDGGRAFGLAAQEERHTIAVTGGWFAGAALGASWGVAPFGSRERAR